MYEDGELPIREWVMPPPPTSVTLDAYRVHDTLAELVTRVNRMSDHMKDIYDLIEFLEKNPGKDIRDWARYEAVRQKMQEAADVATR